MRQWTETSGDLHVLPSRGRLQSGVDDVMLSPQHLNLCLLQPQSVLEFVAFRADLFRF